MSSSLSGRRRPLRRVLLAVALVLVSFPLAVVGVGCALSGPVHRGGKTDHFDGERFRNLREVPHGGFGAFLRWQFTRERGPWTDLPGPIGSRPPERVEPGKLRVTFVNHATTLVQQDGVNVLTDPIWSERCSPFPGSGRGASGRPGSGSRSCPASTWWW